jgi:hypothetical protein
MTFPQMVGRAKFTNAAPWQAIPILNPPIMPPKPVGNGRKAVRRLYSRRNLHEARALGDSGRFN